MNATSPIIPAAQASLNRHLEKLGHFKKARLATTERDFMELQRLARLVLRHVVSTKRGTVLGEFRQIGLLR